jgi:acylphosphatase
VGEAGDGWNDSVEEVVGGEGGYEFYQIEESYDLTWRQFRIYDFVQSHAQQLVVSGLVGNLDEGLVVLILLFFITSLQTFFEDLDQTRTSVSIQDIHIVFQKKRGVTQQQMEPNSFLLDSFDYDVLQFVQSALGEVDSLSSV